VAAQPHTVLTHNRFATCQRPDPSQRAHPVFVKLGLQDQLPHYTTLQKFSTRTKVLEIADAMNRIRLGGHVQPLAPDCEIMAYPFGPARLASTV
jgi:hypothetical protein